MSDILATITDSWSDGKRLHVVGTLAFAGTYAKGGLTLNWALAGVPSQMPPIWFDAPPYMGYQFRLVKSAVDSISGKLEVRLVSGQSGIGIFTSDGTNPAADGTVTVGATEYTFKAAISTTANQVLIGATAAATMQNLVDAINANPDKSGITFGSATTANATEYATLSASGLIVTVVARLAGENTDATSEASTHLAATGAATAGGATVSATPGELAAAAFPTDLAVLAVPFYAIFNQLM